MKIIPVIDLYHGQVVHAISGQRDQYRPVQSILLSDIDLPNLISSFLNLYPFESLYIADLDAIQDQGNNRLIIDKLRQQFHDLNFWIDTGTYDFVQINSLKKMHYMPVIGTESNVESSELKILRKEGLKYILSLDFKNNKLLGDKGILQHQDFWPDDIILMNLSSVGVKRGPDIKLVKQIKSLCAGKNIYVAGGIRNMADINTLKNMDISGCLVATALHDGNISKEDLQNLQSPD